MLHDFFTRPQRRHVRDLNLVPIIDMFTTVVFFLLLSASFDSFTKITLPPSATVSIENPDQAEPLAPKMVLVQNSPAELELIVSWRGEKPGELSQRVAVSGGRRELMQKASALVKDFAKQFPEEKALQVGIEGNLSYQNLTSVMDGAREVISNIVLISYEEAQDKQ